MTRNTDRCKHLHDLENKEIRKFSLGFQKRGIKFQVNNVIILIEKVLFYYDFIVNTNSKKFELGGLFQEVYSTEGRTR